MARIELARSFKKTLKKRWQRLIVHPKWITAIYHLQTDTPMPNGLKDHALTGNLQGFRECHIEGNDLLVYAYSQDDNNNKVATLYALCNHDDLNKLFQ